MGVVYKARQVSLDRLVALKMLRDSALAGPDQLVRLRTEAAAAARLQHPNIVQIFDLSEHDGLPFYAMEYVPGGNLAQWLEGKPAEPREAAELVETLARAVHFAHQQGILHRDLKPANILLASPVAPVVGGSRLPLGSVTPKISDFGLAKRLDAAPGLTPSTAVLGTPSYMAPEQAGGQGGAVGPATDVYALGAILYECLTGKPPFESDSLLKTLDQVRYQEPTPPSQARPEVPADLDAICLRCLRKEPDRRYDSAAALAEDLQNFLSGKPLAADQPDAPADLAQVPGYEVWQELARGGVWVVYKARDVRAKRLVALKRVRPGSPLAPHHLTQLRAIVDVARKLEHPHVAAVVDAGGRGQRLYVAVELVEGGSLARKLAGQSLAPVDAAWLLERLARAVHHAHEKGLIHCHLSLGNVLLGVAPDSPPQGTPGGSKFEERLGVPKLIGFEIARRRQEAGSPEDLDAIRPMSPAMAPEQLFGKPEQIGPATDVYSLGVILYELLTGRPPYRAATTSDLLLQVGFDTLQPPRRINLEVPAGVDRVCMKCLEKDPAKRYATGLELAEDLVRFQKGEPVLAPGRTWWERCKDRLRAFFGRKTPRPAG
jgi:serine/threonine protein kinase